MKPVEFVLHRFNVPSPLSGKTYILNDDNRPAIEASLKNIMRRGLIGMMTDNQKETLDFKKSNVEYKAEFAKTAGSLLGYEFVKEKDGVTLIGNVALSLPARELLRKHRNYGFSINALGVHPKQTDLKLFNPTVINAFDLAKIK